jgi:hypothetical protein
MCLKAFRLKWRLIKLTLSLCNHSNISISDEIGPNFAIWRKKFLNLFTYDAWFSGIVYACWDMYGSWDRIPPGGSFKEEKMKSIANLFYPKNEWFGENWFISRKLGFFPKNLALFPKFGPFPKQICVFPSKFVFFPKEFLVALTSS